MGCSLMITRFFAVATWASYIGSPDEDHKPSMNSNGLFAFSRKATQKPIFRSHLRIRRRADNRMRRRAWRKAEGYFQAIRCCGSSVCRRIDAEALGLA